MNAPAAISFKHRPTAAQARASLVAKHALEDFVVCFPADDVARTLAEALIAAHGAAVAERIANEIGRAAHIAGRG